MHRYLPSVVAIVICVTVCLFAFAEPSGPDPAQSDRQTTKVPEHVKVVVVDIAALFKRHAAFKAIMDKVKVKVDAADAKVQEKQKQLQALAEKLKDTTLAPTERSRITADIVQQQSPLTAEVTIQKAEFQQEESKIYYDLIQRIKRTIQRYCEKNDIQLVIRINNEPIDPNDRDKILQGINAPIPYCAPSLDITEDILAEMSSDEPGQ